MKILISVKDSVIKPSGGVSGYCYNIQVERNRINDNEIFFLHDKQKIFIQKVKNLIKNLPLISSYYNKTRTDDNAIVRYIKSVRASKGDYADLSDYDAVHFQTTFDLYRNRKILESYKGVILLTSHSPKVSYKEYAEDCVSTQTYLDNKTLFDSAEEFDEYAFKKADYIIFPCPGAEEPYYHSWPLYKTIRDEKKIRYVSTGILPAFGKKTRTEIRKELNIPENAIVLSFVGRHNKVKGYDLLIDIFSKLDDVYVLCCGNIGSIKPPDSDRWIEIGWTTDPYSYVEASDIYMLPNRETYFDIAMLQTLSIGKCSVISNTGGNKEFVKTPGVKLYNTINEAVKFINEFIAMSKKERKELEKLQQKEFKDKYTIEIFYKNYKETIRGLIEEKNNGK